MVACCSGVTHRTPAFLLGAGIGIFLGEDFVVCLGKWLKPWAPSQVQVSSWCVQLIPLHHESRVNPPPPPHAALVHGNVAKSAVCINGAGNGCVGLSENEHLSHW